MKHLVNGLGALIAIVFWLSGVVLAEAGGLTITAVIIPPYAWYLSIEHAMKLLGLN